MRYFVFAMFVILISCKEKKKKFVVIPQERFISLLMDYHLANAMIYTNVYSKKTKVFRDYNIKDSVIRSHGYTKAIFDSTVSYYASIPEQYDIVYDSVITRLSRYQALVQKRLAEKNEKERKIHALEEKRKNRKDSLIKTILENRTKSQNQKHTLK